MTADSTREWDLGIGYYISDLGIGYYSLNCVGIQYMRYRTHNTAPPSQRVYCTYALYQAPPRRGGASINRVSRVNSTHTLTHLRAARSAVCLRGMIASPVYCASMVSRQY